MEIKFNCSNPSCRQRIGVDSSYAGRSLPCPACSTTVQVPDPDRQTSADDIDSSPEIVFRCSKPECGQRIAVNWERAGHWLKCPACNRPLKAPGKARDSVIPQHSRTEPSIERTPPAHLEIRRPIKATFVRRCWWLFRGWSVGAVILCGLMVALRLHSAAKLPPHLDAILNEIYFHGEILSAPVINHAGTKLVYQRTIEDGVGIFLVDLGSLERTQIALAKASDSERGGAVKLFGWSPDDRFLAFSTIQQGDQNRHVMICDGTSGKTINSFDSPQPLQEGNWLNTRSLVLLDHSQKVSLYNLEADNSMGRLGNQGLVSLKELDSSAGWLVPDSDHSIAYVEKGNLWSLDISTSQAAQLTHFTNGNAEWLDYDAAQDKYLFDLEENSSTPPVLYQYDPRAPHGTELSALTNDNYAFKAQWIESGRGIVFVGNQNNRYCLTVESRDPASRTNLFTAPPIDPNNKGGYAERLFLESRQVVRTFTANLQRNKIYTVASIRNEPLAIWEYDLATRALRNVVPENEDLKFSKFITPVEASATRENGNSFSGPRTFTKDPHATQIEYYYVPPAHLEPGRKYPMVLDLFSDHGFQPNAQFLANVDIFYVTVDPYGTGLQKNDALAVYHKMLQNPNIDARRVYLLGESKGTCPEAELLDSYPELWRGGILLSSVDFPKNPNSRGTSPSFFMSEGDQDVIERQIHAEQFYQQACSQLLRARITYAHAGHIFFDLNQLKQRYKDVATFILTDN